MTQSTTPRAPTPAEIDPVVEAVREALLQRSQLGIKKYGDTLHNKNYPEREILQHAIEEAMDLSNYLMARIMKIDAALTADASEDAPKQGDAHRIMLAAGFAVAYDKRTGVHTYTGFIEDAERALAARPAPVGAGMAVDGLYMADERKRFEEWAGNPPVEIEDIDADPESFWCWSAWQAALGLSPSVRGPAVAPAAPTDSVPVPTTADQAAMMALLGTNYLQAHAPERLKAAPVADAMQAGTDAKITPGGAV